MKQSERPQAFGGFWTDREALCFAGEIPDLAENDTKIRAVK